MKNRRNMGILIATVWLAGIFALGAWVPTLDPVKANVEDQPFQLPKVTNPALVRDRNEVVKMMKVARQMPKDFDYLSKQYDQIPAFPPPDDPDLTPGQVGRFIIACDSYRNEMNNFTHNTVGDQVSVFRAIALYGMIDNFYQLVRMRALVRVNMTNEEFEWVRDRVFSAGLFAVLSALEDGQYDSEEQKKHLEGLRDELYKAVGAITKTKDGVITIHPEKFDRYSVPRSNIALFLAYYRRPNQPGINWPNIHFHRPTVITFNREAIMAKAANNPP